MSFSNSAGQSSGVWLQDYWAPLNERKDKMVGVLLGPVAFENDSATTIEKRRTPRMSLYQQ
jgi:hypothetical protein